MLVLNDITVSDPTHETPNSVRGKEERNKGTVAAPSFTRK